MDRENMKILVIERLKELIKVNNLNQARLAEKTGISQSTISAWLAGKSEPSVKSLCILSKFFNVKVNYLVGLSDTPKNK